MTRFIVRQYVKNAYRGEMVELCGYAIERPARREYNRLVEEFPGEYFELVQTEYSEECLEWTKKCPDG